MRKKVSLKDIANRVGVSITLVSYVLNNKKLNRISTQIAEKIKETARELNYKPNQVAMGLKTNKTHTIGLLVADISNAFSSSMARIIEHEAEKYNYTVIFGSSDENDERSKKLIDVLLHHQVDGLIIAPTGHGEDQVKNLLENEVPFVLIDRHFNNIASSYVALDNVEAAKNLCDHLIDIGCRRIGLISYNAMLNNIAERKQGYLKALQEHNIPVDEAIIKEVLFPIDPTEINNAIDEMLRGNHAVDGILFTANMLSLHGLKHLNTLPLKVPDDLAVATFDESEAADLFYAPLTHIKQPLKEMGKLAVETLMNIIEGRQPMAQHMLPGELVIRQSTVKKKP